MCLRIQCKPLSMHVEFASAAAAAAAHTASFLLCLFICCCCLKYYWIFVVYIQSTKSMKMKRKTKVRYVRICSENCLHTYSHTFIAFGTENNANAHFKRVPLTMTMTMTTLPTVFFFLHFVLCFSFPLFIWFN